MGGASLWLTSLTMADKITSGWLTCHKQIAVVILGMSTSFIHCKHGTHCCWLLSSVTLRVCLCAGITVTSTALRQVVTRRWTPLWQNFLGSVNRIVHHCRMREPLNNHVTVFSLRRVLPPRWTVLLLFMNCTSTSTNTMTRYHTHRLTHGSEFYSTETEGHNDAEEHLQLLLSAPSVC